VSRLCRRTGGSVHGQPYLIFCQDATCCPILIYHTDALSKWLHSYAFSSNRRVLSTLQLYHWILWRLSAAILRCNGCAPSSEQQPTHQSSSIHGGMQPTSSQFSQPIPNRAIGTFDPLHRQRRLAHKTPNTRHIHAVRRRWTKLRKWATGMR
jgi:hypothetical protein